MTFFDLPKTGTDPFQLFNEWLEDAKSSEINDPDAMCLATCGSDGQPSARMVLFRGAGPEGFTFNTNMESHKGRDIAENPKAALCIHWKSLGRQIRIEGRVEMLDEVETDKYFSMRPRGSKIGAWVSHQSQEVESRDKMFEQVKEVEATYGDGDIPRPPYWRGYRVVPERMEFWQQGEYRLHDRFEFIKNETGDWTARRLYP
ncbi:MAG TPA: pyridoxamine 5'-phosphate oxidase [Alphaproteobacteria bacterium]